MHKRKVLVTNTSGVAPSLNNLCGFKFMRNAKLSNENDKSPIKPMEIHKKLLMTPGQFYDNSRKLLQMKTIGSDNPFMEKRAKDESDINTKLNYVSQLKDDTRGVQTWSKSFTDAINAVTVVNKEFLENVEPNYKKIFQKIIHTNKKTVVFGLDGVLVKTSFEKNSPEFKISELIINKQTNQKMKIYVAIRPFVVNTLKQLKRAGMELIAYSSSQYNYTSAILNVLTKQRIDFHHIICAEDHEKATS